MLPRFFVAKNPMRTKFEVAFFRIFSIINRSKKGGVAVIVTSVSPAKQHLVCIEFDDGQSGLIDKTVWEHVGYAIGTHLDDKEWEALCDRSARHRAREKALYYLSLRDYGSGELIKKLVTAQIPRSLAEETVEKLVSCGLINDERYALMLATDMQNRKLYPKRRIGMALREKGFSSVDIETALANLPDEEEQQALEFLIKKRYNIKNDPTKREKALAMLARYGFSYAVSKRALDRLEDEDC